MIVRLVIVKRLPNADTYLRRDCADSIENGWREKKAAEGGQLCKGWCERSLVGT